MNIQKHGFLILAILIAIIFAIVNLSLKTDKNPNNKKKKQIFGSISLVFFVITILILTRPMFGSFTVLEDIGLLYLLDNLSYD